jgi:hypothetical protein
LEPAKLHVKINARSGPETGVVAQNSGQGMANMRKTRYFDSIDVLSLSGMIAVGYMRLTFGPLP